MHDHLKDQVELMGYKAQNVMEDSNVEQDFLIKARLMRICRTSDFTEDELAYYQSVNADERFFVGGRIQTPDFTEDELREYQWAAEHPTGSCRGYRLTDEPTEEEVKDWQERLAWLNTLDLATLRKKAMFEREEPEPVVRQGDESYNNTQIVASCPLGSDPYSLHHGW